MKITIYNSMSRGWFVMPRGTLEACVSRLGVVFNNAWHNMCLGTSILDSSEAMEDPIEIPIFHKTPWKYRIFMFVIGFQ